MMPYFCVSLRAASVGGSVSGSFTEVDDNFKIITPQTNIGADFFVDDLDLIIGALPDTTTIVTFWGSAWFHTIGPNACKRYGSIVDLGGIFVANRRFFVPISALDAVDECSAHDASAIVQILQTITTKGRITWRKKDGGLAALWVPNFYVPIRELHHKHPPSWITTPQRLDLQTHLF